MKSDMEFSQIKAMEALTFELKRLNDHLPLLGKLLSKSDLQQKRRSQSERIKKSALETYQTLMKGNYSISSE